MKDILGFVISLLGLIVGFIAIFLTHLNNKKLIILKSELDYKQHIEKARHDAFVVAENEIMPLVNKISLLVNKIISDPADPNENSDYFKELDDNIKAIEGAFCRHKSSLTTIQIACIEEFMCISNGCSALQATVGVHQQIVRRNIQNNIAQASNNLKQVMEG